MNKRIIIPALIFTAAMCAVPSRAQEIDRQIEVVREYIPDVGSARKLDFSPRMIDTVALKPVFEYSINPTPWKGVFQARPLDPVEIDATQFRLQRPFYARIAAGIPFQTLADIYATANTRSDLALGAYVNHYGRWAKIKDELGDRQTATASKNVAGAFLEKKFRRSTLSVKIEDDYRIYRDRIWAQFPTIWPSDNLTRKLAYNNFGVSVTFGDAFFVQDRFNYRLGVSGDIFTSREDDVYRRMGGFFESAWKMGNGNFSLATGYYHASGNSRQTRLYGIFPTIPNDDGFKDDRFNLAPRYSLYINDLSLEIGLNFLYNRFMKDTEYYIFPKVRLVYDIAPGFIPYLDVDGGLEDGSIKALSYRNPYVVPGGYVLNPSYYSAVLGAYGSISRAVSYDLAFGCRLYDNYTYFMMNHVNYEPENPDSPALIVNHLSPRAFNHTKRTNIFYVEANLSALIAKGLQLDLRARYNSVNDVVMDQTTVSASIPEFELGLGLKYVHREKFFVTLTADAVGARKFNMNMVTYSGVIGGGNTVMAQNVYRQEYPATVNLKLDVEYKVSDWLNVFVLGDNLLNHRIYRYGPAYPELGVNFMLGVKLSF